MTRTAPWLALAGLLPALGGCCAAFRSGRLARIGNWPPGPRPAAEQMKAVSLNFVARGCGDGGGALDPRTRAIYRNATYWAYDTSDRFVHVRPDPEPAELHANVRLVERLWRAPGFLRFACGITLGLVPSWERRDLILITTITSQDGKELAYIEKRETVTTWCQLLLTLVFPFAPPPGVRAKCVYDLNRATITEAYRNGVY